MPPKMRLRNIFKKKYKESNSSGEMTIDIEQLSQIPTQSSKWNKEQVAALNIEYANVDDITELIKPAELKDDDNFKKLILENWNKRNFLSANNTIYENMENKQIATIIRKINTILSNESTESFKETKVDAFIMSLLYFLGFDQEPFAILPQYDYSIYLNNGQHKITSKVECMITRQGTFIVLVVKDKHPSNVSEFKDWSEPQIAGEILGAAYHNVFISKLIQYPFYIHAIRVIGTKITFYKSTITHEYLTEAETRLPRAHRLEIKRFPGQPSSSPSQGRELVALDFTNESDLEVYSVAYQ
ncbi:unnamed protein product [Cunninghamella echinulata]